jgi:7-carboxy-7-deazaguanine synthase
MTLQVNEFFHSIQGESICAGLPCAFVRLSGCNLRCRYCDTTYAYDTGQVMRIDQIVKQLQGFPCRRVTITGGEPLIQSQTPGLITELLNQGYLVSMETNGSQDIRNVDSGCMLVMDLKCPSSGMQDSNRLENIQYLKAGDQIKFVIAGRQDYLFARDVLENQAQHIDGANILFSPTFDAMRPDRLAAWILSDGIDVRLQLQLHRLIWPDRDRGV